MAKGVNACIVDVKISRGAGTERGGEGSEGGIGGGGAKKVAEVRLKREVVEVVDLHSGHEHVRVAVLGGGRGREEYVGRGADEGEAGQREGLGPDAGLEA